MESGRFALLGGMTKTLVARADLRAGSYVQGRQMVVIFVWRRLLTLGIVATYCLGLTFLTRSWQSCEISNTIR